MCSQCGKVLEEGGFFEEKGAIFCPSCYDVRYAPSCAKCKKKIAGVSGAGGRASEKGHVELSALFSCVPQLADVESDRNHQGPGQPGSRGYSSVVPVLHAQGPGSVPHTNSLIRCGGIGF